MSLLPVAIYAVLAYLNFICLPGLEGVPYLGSKSPQRPLRKNMKYRKHTRAGFSMVEMLMVLAILGIVVTLTISGLLSARPHAQLERGDLVVSQTLNRARNIAVSDEKNVRVLIDPDENTMTIQQADAGTDEYETVDEPIPLPDGVDFDEDGITFDNSRVEFTPRGSLIAGGDLRTVNSAGETTTFSGNLATGRFPLSGGHLR